MTDAARTPREQAAASDRRVADLWAQITYEDLAWVLSDARGRRAIQRILVRAGVAAAPGAELTAFPADSETLQRTVGGYEIGLSLLQDVRALDPRQVLQMERDLAMSHAQIEAMERSP